MGGNRSDGDPCHFLLPVDRNGVAVTSGGATINTVKPSGAVQPNREYDPPHTASAVDGVTGAELIGRVALERTAGPVGRRPRP
jgi:hypothetical protein